MSSVLVQSFLSEIERRDSLFVQGTIFADYRDLAAGHAVASSGDIKAIMAMLDHKPSF